ncbi:MAG: hypothetical protein AABZ47_06450 [Planctomycetota bacterium]
MNLDIFRKRPDTPYAMFACSHDLKGVNPIAKSTHFGETTLRNQTIPNKLWIAASGDLCEPIRNLHEETLDALRIEAAMGLVGAPDASD